MLYTITQHPCQLKAMLLYNLTFYPVVVILSRLKAKSGLSKFSIHSVSACTHSVPIFSILHSLFVFFYSRTSQPLFADSDTKFIGIGLACGDTAFSMSKLPCMLNYMRRPIFALLKAFVVSKFFTPPWRIWNPWSQKGWTLPSPRYATADSKCVFN